MDIFRNKIIWIGIIAILLASNIYLSVRLIKEQHLRHEFSSSSALWASIAGLDKAELDYIKGVKAEPIDWSFIEDFDKAALELYNKSYSKKMNDLMKKSIDGQCQ